MSTLKVQIAVEVGFDDDGKPIYQAYGASGAEGDWEEAMGGFDAIGGETRHLWVTAEVPLPDGIPEIAGKAEEVAA